MSMNHWGLRLLCGLVVGVLLDAGGSVAVWAGLRDRPSAEVAVSDEVEFESYDALLEWLEGQTSGRGEWADLLGQLSGGGVESHGCIIPSSTPSTISVTRPRAFKVIQLQLRATLGTTPCGLVLCIRVFYELEWATAPASGAILLGPIPPTSGSCPGSCPCQGGHEDVKAFLILTAGIAPGSYSLIFRANGAGEFSSTTIPVHVGG